ncbi:MAG TPA: NAD(+) synthase, partial [Clostridia bacterium]
MNDGFIKVAAATPKIVTADCINNTEEIIKLINQAQNLGVDIVVFPELCITGYTCGDLFLQQALQESAKQSLEKIIEASQNAEMIICIGLPIAFDEKLYNCAAVISQGKLLGLVPKKHIPNYAEFYELRYFTGGEIDCTVNIFGQDVLLSNKQIFVHNEIKNFSLGVEICEDLWVIEPPSIKYIKAGATIIANLSASNEIIGKADYRKLLVASQSGRGVCGYIYSDAGSGESSTDMVFAGHNIIAENGTILQESSLFYTGLTVTEIDIDKLSNERLRMKFIKDDTDIKKIPFFLKKKHTELTREISQNPFIPKDQAEISKRCETILNIQAYGLVTRLQATGIKKVIIGLSGGLDSTLALIVSIKAFEIMGLDKKDIIAVSMPSVANSSRTKNNSRLLATLEGITFLEIPIKKAIEQHMDDIGNDINNFGLAYENAQARERTQILMDIANNINALMVGTGDLSELALGFTTYGGDHMSMYGVNCSIPKTLVRHLVWFEATKSEGTKKSEVLKDILNTPISPELIPSDSDKISQKTEEIIGPYELHDFFLYYAVRFGFGPKKIFRLAKYAFKELYSDEIIKKWLTVFYKRFFANQFKRS